MPHPDRSSSNARRYARVCVETVDHLRLDLSGLVVATEAATGPYASTATLAALAGATDVLTLAASTRHGSAEDSVAQTLAVAREAGTEGRIRAFVDRDSFPVELADVVTNLGPLRPFDAAFLNRLGPLAALPYMCETWEFRPEDVDLDEARRLGIPVLGTKETAPELRIFDYVGATALRLLLNLEVDVIASHVVILGSGVFGDAIADVLSRTGATVTLLNGADPDALPVAAPLLEKADALVIAEYPGRQRLIGGAAPLSATNLAAINPSLRVAHISGGVERAEFEAAGLECAPERFAPAGWMSVATDYVGPRPVLRLHGAGLAVGAALSRARRAGLHGADAEQQVASTLALADPFWE